MILHEIHSIERFPRMQQFLSYCRLVKPTRESAGKLLGHAGAKIGNAYLRWAFSELATTPAVCADEHAVAALERVPAA